MTEQRLDDDQVATRGMLKELKVELKAEINELLHHKYTSSPRPAMEPVPV